MQNERRASLRHGRNTDAELQKLIDEQKKQQQKNSLKSSTQGYDTIYVTAPSDFSQRKALECEVLRCRLEITTINLKLICSRVACTVQRSTRESKRHIKQPLTSRSPPPSGSRRSLFSPAATTITSHLTSLVTAACQSPRWSHKEFLWELTIRTSLASWISPFQ